MGTDATDARFRKIKVRSPDGTPLWDGLPTGLPKYSPTNAPAASSEPSNKQTEPPKSPFPGPTQPERSETKPAQPWTQEHFPEAEIVSGKWSIEGDELERGAVEEGRAMMIFGNPDWSRYNLSVKVKMIDAEPKAIPIFFNVRDAQNHRSFHIGSYVNNRHSVSTVLDGQTDWNVEQKEWGKLESGQWYDVRLQARGADCRCILDNKKWFDSHEPRLTKGRVGLGSLRTAVRFKDIVIKSEDDKTILWQGLPKLPDRLRPGSVWEGTRSYRSGGYAGGTVTYELHVRSREGAKFEGHVFDNGTNRNRSEVEGEIDGTRVTWRERRPGATSNFLMNIEGTIDANGDTITLKLDGGFDINPSHGDGELKLRQDSVASQGGKSIPAGNPTAPAEQESQTPVAPQGEPKQSSAPFFNGKDLTGWRYLPAYWRVENGAIVGAPLAGAPADTFLYSEGTYKDFKLAFKVRVKNDVGNSGVQIRSWIPDFKEFKLLGPQVEIACDSPAEYPTGSIVTEPLGDPAITANSTIVAGAWKKNDFNTITIVCVGKHVTTTINDITIVNADFPKMPDEGHIAWQLHGKRSPEEITFKDIEFTDLSRQAVSPTNASSFVRIFNAKDLEASGWTAENGDKDRWSAKDGAIVAHGAGAAKRSYLLWSQDLADFELRFEFMFERGASSGVALRAQEKEVLSGGARTVFDHPIIKLGENAKDPTGTSHWLQDRRMNHPADDKRLLDPDLWHRMSIRVQGEKCTATVNETKIVDIQLVPATGNSKITPGLARKQGRIGFQAHTGTVRFRNVEVRDLPPDDGFVPIFNGRDLTGWEANERPENWKVEDGAIVGRGPQSYLFYMAEEFEDCEFKADVKINRGGNSGMFFRTRFEPGVPKGYEAQVFNGAHRKRTGSLWNFVDVTEPLVPDDTWFNQHIIVRRNHIVIKVNGKIVVDFTDQKNTYTRGYLALQQHEPNTVVQFKNLMVKKLSASK